MVANREDIGSELDGALGGHALGGLNPDEAQLRALLGSDEPGPLQFVNLLAFRDQAVYPEGHELAGTGLSGVEAYGRYGAVALGHVTRRGGTMTLFTEVRLVLVGRDVPWDQVAIVTYPSIDVFVDMIGDPDYQAALVHRDAGLAETVLLVTRSLLPA